MKNLLGEAEALQQKLVQHRRYLHENAEIHNDLPIASAYVKEQLTQMGYLTRDVSKCGVVALAGKAGGKTFLLRADMDALPIAEETELSFRSQNGNMHACGHDMHTAMLLGAAQLLKEHESELTGQVKLMFQPAEETMAGAAAMIDAGVLENPAVDAAFMIHVITGIPLPTGRLIVPSLVPAASAGSDWFKVTVHGKGGHGASPEKAIDPLIVLSQICLSLQTINAREVAPGEQIVLTCGQMHGGNTSNVIPETAFLSGSIRTYGSETRAFVRERVRQIAEGIAAAFRARADVEFERSCPSFAIDTALQQQICASGGELLGEEKLIPMERVFGVSRLPGSEDFASVSERVPSMMVMLTAGTPADGYAHLPHHPKTAFDEDALSIGAALYANTAIEWLKNNC